jgi:hypothetical protein
MASSSHIHFFNPALSLHNISQEFSFAKTLQKRFPEISLPQKQKTHSLRVGRNFLALFLITDSPLAS